MFVEEIEKKISRAVKNWEETNTGDFNDSSFLTYILTLKLLNNIDVTSPADSVNINNKLYIIIGAKSAKVFFPKEDFNNLIFKNNKLNGKLAIVLPHPSPLNIKWFKDHPEFMKKRILEIRKIVNKVLEEN